MAPTDATFAGTECAPERVLGGGWKDWGLVFPSRLGTPLQENTIRRVFARICRLAEVPLIRLHDLRHTCATLMLLAGVNVKVVSERLGHASVVISGPAESRPILVIRRALSFGQNGPGMAGLSSVALWPASSHSTPR